MGRPRKPDPIKHCEQCGELMSRKRQRNGDLESMLHFGRRKFCDRKCMAANFDARPVTATPNWMTAHHHARKLVPKGPCEKCGNPKGMDVHHINEDWRDNRRENLIRLCRSCHLKIHRYKSSSVA